MIERKTQLIEALYDAGGETRDNAIGVYDEFGRNYEVVRVENQGESAPLAIIIRET